MFGLCGSGDGGVPGGGPFDLGGGPVLLRLDLAACAEPFGLHGPPACPAAVAGAVARLGGGRLGADDAPQPECYHAAAAAGGAGGLLAAEAVRAPVQAGQGVMGAQAVVSGAGAVAAVACVVRVHLRAPLRPGRRGGRLVLVHGLPGRQAASAGRLWGGWG